MMVLLLRKGLARLGLQILIVTQIIMGCGFR